MAKVARLKEPGSRLEIRGKNAIHSGENISEEAYKKLIDEYPSLADQFEVVEEPVADEKPAKTSSSKASKDS